jgi:hypothetical protein
MAGDWTKLNKLFVLPAKYHEGGKRTEKEMGGTCGKNVREEKCIQRFGEETWRQNTYKTHVQTRK